jgi:transcriptional regulator with XRE-family HTH domain
MILEIPITIYIISFLRVVNSTRIGKPLGMVHPAQIRAARALLGWRQDDLAKLAGVGVATVRRIETLKLPAGNVATLVRIQQALEKAGVLFLDADQNFGFGVRLRLDEGTKSSNKDF